MSSSNIVSYIMLGVVLIAMFVFMILQGRKQKKAQEDYVSMLDSLRPGTKVKMASGLLGRIKDIREEAPGFKTVTLNIGEDKNVVEMTFVIEAVQGIVNEEAINKLKLEKLAEEQQASVNNEVASEDVPAETTADAVNDVETVAKTASKKATKKRK
ncbi:MAG: preprotein translocase subunit YajC [Clostridia bacterium]|nr:preprotein translocase subunit YajC [Clostridia bacterium]